METSNEIANWEAILAAEGMAAELPRDEREVLAENPRLEAARELTPDLMRLAEADLETDEAAARAEEARRNISNLYAQ